MLCWVFFPFTYWIFTKPFWELLYLIGDSKMLSGRWDSVSSGSPHICSGTRNTWAQTACPTLARSKSHWLLGKAPWPPSSELVSDEHPRAPTCFCCFPALGSRSAELFSPAVLLCSCSYSFLCLYRTCNFSVFQESLRFSSIHGFLYLSWILRIFFL